MFTRVSESDFTSWFARSEERKNQFSYNGLVALYEYLEEMEEDIGPMEFDPIALCCEYTEFATAWEAMKQYRPEDMPNMGEESDDLVEIQEKNEVEAVSWLQDQTLVLQFDGGIIIREF